MSKINDHVSEELIEKLAERVHNIWMEERIKDGWKYGPFRDDIHRTTPCIVPYEQLPEEEKKYDRRIVETVIEGMIISDN